MTPFSARMAGAFAVSPSGHLLFTPFGDYGPAYLVSTKEEAATLRRGMWCIVIPGLVIMLLGVSSLWIGRRILTAAILWKIGLAIPIGFAVWTAIFLIWVSLVSSRLQRAERDGTVIGAVQPDDDAPVRRRRVIAPTVPDPTPLPEAGHRLLVHVAAQMEDDSGVAVDSLLLALGGLAGFAAQVGLREAAATAGEAAPLIRVDTQGGRVFYFGDAVNALVAEAPESILAIVSRPATLTDGPSAEVLEIFRHVTATVGSEAFGVPRTPGLTSGDLPIDLLWRLWPSTAPLLAAECRDPREWPLALAHAAREAVAKLDGIFDPDTAVRLVMESAIPMSKIDPGEIGIAY